MAKITHHGLIELVSAVEYRFAKLSSSENFRADKCLIFYQYAIVIRVLCQDLGSNFRANSFFLPLKTSNYAISVQLGVVALPPVRVGFGTETTAVAIH